MYVFGGIVYTRLDLDLTPLNDSLNVVFNRVQSVLLERPSQLRTSSSAIAEGPRDALSQLKSCQLLHNCTNNHI